MSANLPIQNLLDRQVQAGSFAHAYLFVGPKETGKKELALSFAKKVLENEGLSSHPDFLHFDCAADSSAENVREFISRLSLKPFVAKQKFALISNIENLNVQGSNSLLKTLEEPAPGTIIVLTANTRKILPTIFSRCQVFNFNRKQTQKRQARTDVEGGGLVSIINFAGKDSTDRLLAINKFAELEEAELKQEIEDFIFESAGVLAAEPEKYTYLAAGLKAYEDLNTNKNKKLLLQGLMLKL